MKIIIKFLLNNIREKKFRTFLIVFSIMMSSALFFASNAMSSTIEDMYTGIIKSYFGNSEIMVSANESSPSSFLYENKADRLKDEMDYIIGSIQLTGVYKFSGEKELDVSVSIQGFNLKDLQIMNPLVLENQLQEEEFTGKKIIISKKTAEKYHIGLGDSINIEIKDSRYKFKVVGISKVAGLFLGEKGSTMGIVPKDMLYNLAEGTGKVSTLYIKTKDPFQIQKSIEDLSKIYKDYDVKETMDSENMKQASDSIVVPLNMMGVIVLSISIFIIYSAFKVITTERLPIVGTFRSIGATKKMMNSVLLGESLIYGVIGGMIGVIVGIGVLYLMSMVVAQLFGGAETTIKYTSSQMIASFILAIILSIISSMVPILRVSSISVKDIVLNNVSKEERTKHWKLIVGIIFALFSVISPRIVPNKLALLVDGISMILLIIATIFLVPYITLIFVKILEKLYIYIFGNEGVLAVKNLKGNKSVLNNISLLAIGISSMLMISTISNSLAIEVPKVFKQSNFDMIVNGKDLNDEFVGMLKNIKGVKDIYGVYKTYGVKIEGRKENIAEIDGIDKSKFFDFYSIEFLGDARAIVDKLSMGRNIIITKSLKERWNLKEGDKLILEINKTKREYTIVGFVDYQWNNGSMAFISDRYFKQDMNVQSYSEFCVKTNKSPSEVKETIEKKYSKRGISINTIEELTKLNVEGNAQFMMLLNVFSIMAMVIGTFGVLNNFMISFMERKRSIAMFRSIGMSKRQNIKVLFIESFTGGTIGGIAGILSGISIISITPYLVYATSNFKLPMYYSIKAFALAFIAGTIITIIASIGPALKSSKLNIIEAIKYE